MYDPDDDDEDDDDWPDDDDDDESLLVSCPSCGAEIYEDAVQCPVCGDYVTHTHSVWSGRPVWWILIGLAGIVGTTIALTLF